MSLVFFEKAYKSGYSEPLKSFLIVKVISLPGFIQESPEKEKKWGCQDWERFNNSQKYGNRRVSGNFLRDGF